ncbi:MAG: hypothetical protein M3Y17_12905 [Actinomycetota bacterium]|nr:hypothetical protein [Actinomycetota bacterium]
MSAASLSLAIACLASGGAGTAGARAAGQCQNLRLTATVRGQLYAAYRRATHLPTRIRLKALASYYGPFYGRCGKTYYAYLQLYSASVQHVTLQEKVEQQDQSYVNRRVGHGRWMELRGFTSICELVPGALARVWHLTVCASRSSRVSFDVVAGVSASRGLRSCGSFTERHGINTVQISERNVSCPNARELDRTWERRLARRQVPASVLDARPYGHFGARYRIGAFVCRFAATGLAGDEYRLVCDESSDRTVRVDRG